MALIGSARASSNPRSHNHQAMRSLAELIDSDDPGIVLIREWADASELNCEILPPSDRREDVLLAVQVTSRSTLGALAYDTGGVLIDDGWLRFLGSGHPKIGRDLAQWNQDRANGFYLVGDDAAGGFFALNTGRLGPNMNRVYYWSPDDLEWEDLDLGLTDFLAACFSSRLATFYSDLRWADWREEVRSLPGDRCFSFVPFLWTAEGSVEKSVRSSVPVAEAFDNKLDIVRQLAQGDTRPTEDEHRAGAAPVSAVEVSQAPRSRLAALPVAAGAAFTTLNYFAMRLAVANDPMRFLHLEVFFLTVLLIPLLALAGLFGLSRKFEIPRFSLVTAGGLVGASAAFNLWLILSCWAEV
ncbi:MAG: DUF2625 family protein [Acidobacteriota bacterium]